jgi:NAD(P)-dependent dehydrogenase (short-subunit alcohol dehydrogenase family)
MPAGAETETESTNMKLDGQVAVIPGASRGIGRAIADLYAREGASVVLADIDESAAMDAAKAIAAAYGRPTLAN